MRAGVYQSRAAVLTTQLTTANNQASEAEQQIDGLQSQVATLTYQAADLQSQLAAAANERAKVQDRAPVPAPLLMAAGAAAGNLSSCVTSSFNLADAALDAENTGRWGSVSSMIDAVTAQCRQAQIANAQLQQVINNG